MVVRGGGRRKINWKRAQRMTSLSDRNVLYTVLDGGCSSYIFVETCQNEYLICTIFFNLINSIY